MIEIRSILEFPLRSQIFIGLCAAALTFQTGMIHGMYMSFQLTVLTFFGTVLVYSTHRLNKLTSEKSESERNYLTLLKGLIVLSAINMVILLLKLDWHTILVLFAGGLIALLYTSGFSFIGIPALRKIPYFKSFFVALIWTLVTALIPLVEMQATSIHYLMLPGRFFFLFALALPFDIRDMETDATENLKTLPLLVGVRKSHIISWISVGLFLIFEWMEHSYGVIDFSILFAYMVSALITSIFIFFTRPSGSILFYGYLIDGSNLIQTLLVFLSLFILGLGI